MEKNRSFIWSDNWYIENENIWFTGGEHNALFQIDRKKEKYVLMKEFPDMLLMGFRKNPRCIKCENNIFCMPDVGDCIWIYHLETEQFQKLEIDNPTGERISIINFWEYAGKIFAVSVGLRQVIEIDIQEKRIDSYYDLVHEPDERLARSTRAGNLIYTVSATSNKIYQFDMDAKASAVYDISGVNGGFHSICFDGIDFWLSGYRKEVYVWNKESNTLKTIANFPQQFGIYNFDGQGKELLDCVSYEYDTPTFIDSVAIGQYIWFIPFKTNKIVCVDKDTQEIKFFEIDDEEDTEVSLKENYLHHKYLLQCVIEDRYLVLYSIKNNCILEIDTSEGKVEKKTYLYSDKFIENISNIYDKCGMICHENNELERLIFERMLFKKYL